jgi:hypothetical protein
MVKIAEKLVKIAEKWTKLANKFEHRNKLSPERDRFGTGPLDDVLPKMFCNIGPPVFSNE